jgi:3-oxoacyl-[acyl-carrier protein] reductase
MALRLEDKVCIVTGGAHGIGRAYCLRFAEEGARVVVADIDLTAAQQVAHEIEALERQALALPVDVADSKSCEAMAAATVERFGRIDVLVTNAAVFATIPISRVAFDQIDEDEWDRVMTVNVKGVWLSCKAVVPYMRQQGKGKIINIGSGTMFTGTPTRNHYVASKGAVLAFTRSLARELGPDGITVNILCPGSTLSEAEPTEAILKMRESDSRGRSIPRVELPSDLVGPMAFLASDDSDFMTGQIVNVDGGQNMR